MRDVLGGRFFMSMVEYGTASLFLARWRCVDGEGRRDARESR